MKGIIPFPKPISELARQRESAEIKLGEMMETLEAIIREQPETLRTIAAVLFCAVNRAAEIKELDAKEQRQRGKRRVKAN